MEQLTIGALDDPLFWAERCKPLFQPIVSASSLRVHGFESLSRLPADAPFNSTFALLDAAQQRGALFAAERVLIMKAIAAFSQTSFAARAKLFCNLDNRVFDDRAASPEQLLGYLEDVGVHPGNLCIELSERMPPDSDERLAALVARYQEHNIRIAIDDFGRGFSGLETLMLVHPHYVKIDQAFIRDVHISPRKQAIVQNVVRMAHSLGVLVIAEGVETQEELLVIRDAGCDFVQGFLISKPTADTAQLKHAYQGVGKPTTLESETEMRLQALLVETPPLHLGDPVARAVARFKNTAALPFVPILDRDGYVQGAVYESDVSHLIFGDYSAALLSNRGIEHRVDAYMKRCPQSEISASINTMVDAYMVSSSNSGVVLTRDGKYLGTLDNVSMLQLSTERAVAAARDQNPLTALPGNASIQSHVQASIEAGEPRVLVFFDFDNFKAFNDHYGFEAGDRALLMFGERLVKFRQKHEAFVGHIGGDDFFASIAQSEVEAIGNLEELLAGFRSDVESLYSAEAREAGGIWADDRFGQRHFFPMLRASAAAMPIDFGDANCALGGVLAHLARGKSAAKGTDSGLYLHKACSDCGEQEACDTTSLLDAYGARNRMGAT